MREIATAKAFGIYTDQLKLKQIPISELVRGFPISEGELFDQRHRSDWELFIAMTLRFRDLIGGTMELERTGLLAPQANAVKALFKIFSFFTDLKSVYWANARLAGPSIFSNVLFENKIISRNRVETTIEIPHPYNAIPEFFHVYTGVLKSLPTFFNQTEAIVTMRLVEPHKAVYDIVLPPSMTIMARIGRAFRAFIGFQGMLEELRVSNDQIKESYSALTDQQEENRKTRLKLELSSQMAALSRLSALGEMAGGIAHEINNPLMIISGKAAILEAIAKKDPIPRQEVLNHVSSIVSTVERISQIVMSMKVLSRENKEADRTAFPIQKLFEQVLSICKERFATAGVQLTVSAPDVDVIVNEPRISQVLINLLNNAFDAVRDRLENERWITLEAKERGSKIEVSVTDSGTGVPQEIRDRIFDPFFTSKEVGQGTGLGLSISKTFIEGHGGQLQLDPHSTHTRFFFDLEKSR